MSEHPSVDPRGRFFCESCAERFNQPGVCPKPPCDQEPLLDLADPGVRQLLHEFDDQKRFENTSYHILGAFLITSPLYLIALYLLMTSQGRRGAETDLALFAIPMLATIGVQNFLFRKFPGKRRAPQLTDEEIQAFETD